MLSSSIISDICNFLYLLLLEEQKFGFASIPAYLSFCILVHLCTLI